MNANGIRLIYIHERLLSMFIMAYCFLYVFEFRVSVRDVVQNYRSLSYFVLCVRRLFLLKSLVLLRYLHFFGWRVIFVLMLFKRKG